MTSKAPNSIPISIIVPIYNAGGNLKPCIDSILEQAGVDFELILVDDGSTDDSLAMCNQYAKKQSVNKTKKAERGESISTSNDTCRNLYVLHKENGGVSSARNAGIAAAHGDYLCFVDADDELLPNALANLYECVLLHYDVDIVQAPLIIGKTPMEYGKAMPAYTSDRRFIRNHTLFEILGFSAYSKLIRRKMVVDNRIRFAENVAVGEDPLFMFFLHKVVGSVAQCRETCYHYVENAASVMHQSDRTKHIVGALQTAAIAAQSFTVTDGAGVETRYILARLSITRLKDAWVKCDRSRVRQQIQDTYSTVKQTSAPLIVKIAAWRLTLPYVLATSKLLDYVFRLLVKIAAISK